MEIESTCIYCAVGCKLKYEVESNRIIRVLPLKDDPVSKGRPCIKGLLINEVVDYGRILKPMIREGKRFREISWDKAFLTLYKILNKYSGEEIFFSASGKITNEDNFVIQKFVRIVMDSNNIDNCCSRLCHMPTLLAFKDAFGIGASPGYLDEIENLDCLLIVGSNPASNHPVIFNRILEMKEKGGKIILISPIISETADYSDLHLKVNPGTELLFFNCLINLLIERREIKKQCKGFEELKEIVKDYTPEMLEEFCGIKKEEFYEAVNIIANSKNFGIIHGMGLTQHTNAVETLHGLTNLAIITNAKILTNRGEINVQGSGDMLTFPYPLQFSEDVNQKYLRKIWKKELSSKKGTNLIEAIGFGNSKVSFITSFNPAQSMPDLNRIHKNLRKMYIVQLESYFNLTSYFSKLILPTPLLIERKGTITTGERRVRLVRKVRDPPGECMNEWKIFSRLARMFDIKGFEYKDEIEIFEEATKIVKAYNKVDAKKVYSGKDAFADKKIKFLKIIPEKFLGLEEIRSRKYPFILFTFRSKFHFLTNEATGKSKILNKSQEGPYFYLNEEDAKMLKIKNFDEIVVKSKVGSLRGYAFISKRILKGYVGAHFHFENLLVNKLYPLDFDKRSFTPNFKNVAVKIVKVRK
ncbi:MAG: molybdopterin oxidoreductase family protein [Candidatus Aenigmatarchaeota archaeon]